MMLWGILSRITPLMTVSDDSIQELIVRVAVEPANAIDIND